MSLNSSRAKTGIEAMEDLFTLGQFEEAYERGEAEIHERLTALRLPRALLPSRQAVAANSSSSTLSGSSTSATPASTSALNTQAPTTPSLTDSNSLTNSASSSKATSDSSHSSRSLDHRQSFPTGFGPHDADSGHLASSSTPFNAHAKPRDVSFGTLAKGDQETLQKLVEDSVPYLAVMVQCLFELQETSTIPAFLKRLCGSHIQDYPFELAYLLINLYVSQKDYDQARPTCEAMISSIRSSLGPLPLTPRSNILSASYEATTTELGGVEPQSPRVKSKNGAENLDAAPDSPNSSPSSVPGPSADHLDEEDEEEDEATVQLRHNFQSLLQLYIFHVLCETHRFADAKLFLFMEARLHPNVIQEWSVYIDELEQTYLDECKRIQEQRKLSESDLSASSSDNPQSQAGHSSSSSRPNQPGNRDGKGALSTSGPSSNSNAGDGSSNARSLELPLHRKLLHQVMALYNFVKARFNTLSPMQKTVLVAVVVAALASLASIISKTRWMRELGLVEWIAQRLGLSSGAPPSQRRQRLARGPSASAASSSTTPRMGYYGPTAPSRGTLGANRTPQPSSYAAPRYR